MTRWLCIFALLTGMGVVFDAGMNHASARKDAGIQGCYNWCFAHNKTPGSRSTCYNNCDAYYCKVQTAACLAARTPDGGLPVAPRGSSPSKPSEPIVKPPPLDGTK
jgi:hypothetical protein